MSTEPSFSLISVNLGEPHPRAGGSMDFTLTPEQESFRGEVRAWLSKQMRQEWVARLSKGSDIPRPEAYELLRRWQGQLHEAGFVGLTWPKEAGGRGLTFMEEMILQQEMALSKAPPVLNILAIGMAGPTIIAYGTDEQKRRYPPKMLSCEEIWCQGYSEPNAGSDLASLQTRAVKDGEHWVLNGQKVWTSFAQVAHWMMLLARTDPQAPRHKGITYFLLDMKLPGVVVKPLRQITGEAEFNEVFLDNVRVHESEVLGGVNNGWQVVITKDPLWRQKLAQLWIDTECLRVTGARAITKLLRGEMPGAEASTGKMVWVETHQRLQELAMELEGSYGQLAKGSEWAVEGGVWQHSFLRSRANSIE